MDKNIRMAFDTRHFKEYFIKYEMKEITNKLEKVSDKFDKDTNKQYYIFKQQAPIPKKLGTFLLDFMSTNFEDKESCRSFIFEYLFINLLLSSNKFIKEKLDNNIELIENKCEIILTKEEIEYYYDYIYTLYKASFIRYNKLYTYFSDTNKYKLLINDTSSNIISKKLDKYNLVIPKRSIPQLEFLHKLFPDVDFLSIMTPEAICKELSNATFDSIKEFFYSIVSFFIPEFKNSFNITYSVPPFFHDTNNLIDSNIEYYFEFNNFKQALFISFKKIDYCKKIIQKCQNCNKYFIPNTSHDTKYCNSLFEGKKTCKQIGAKKAYKEQMENDILYKKYRVRYKTLAKQASISSENSKSSEMYKYYQQRGPIIFKKYKDGYISAEEFEEWIDSTKLR